MLMPPRPPDWPTDMSSAVRAPEPPQAEYYDFGLPSVDDLEVAAAAAMADVVPAAPSASTEDESMDDGETSDSDADSGSISVADEQVLRLSLHRLCCCPAPGWSSQWLRAI